MKCIPRLGRSYVVLHLVGIILFQSTRLCAQGITIAVLDFDGFGISQTEAIALSNRLRNELFRLGTFEVVDRGMMENILAEQDFQQAGCTSNDCLVEVGRLLGAQQMVGGSISKVGQTFSVSARLVDVETGKVLSVSDFDQRGEIDGMLTRGMGVVALMLSGSEVADLPVASQPATEIAGAQRPRTWSLNVGLGSSRNANVIGITKDVIVGRNFSLYLTSGLGFEFFGIGIAYQQHYNEKGLVISASFAAGYGWETVNSVIGYQLELNRRSFLFGGLGLIGTDLARSNELRYSTELEWRAYPVLSYEYRF